ncbi:MAG: ABC transporter permease [Spirochaetia bacterium]|jgi:ribose/xylose/arabinose/galactoside ABC-type transport system permease subunit
MEATRGTRSRVMQSIQPLLGLVIIYLIFVVLSSTFRTFDTAKTILTQAVILGTLAAGPTIVLISGGLDLSIGSLFCLVAVCTGRMLIAGIPVGLVVLISLVVGAACGAFNGAIIVGTGIPAFIGTLGMMKTFRGLAEILGMNQDMSRFPESFQMIGKGYLIPISIMAVTFLLVYIFLSRTKIGFNCYAIGGSNEVSRLAGVPVKKYYIIYYTIGGLVAAISAIIIVARLNFTNSAFGVGMELNAIAATIIGGTSLSGGVGGIGRTVIGVLIITTLNAGLSHLGVSSSWQQISIGVVIILAVWLDVVQRKREAKA